MNIRENTTKSKSSEISGVDNPTYVSYERSRSNSDANSVTINGSSDGSVSEIPTTRKMSTIAEPVSMSWHNIDVLTKNSSNFSFPFTYLKMVTKTMF